MLEYNELIEVVGGGNTLSGTLLNAMSKIINTVLDTGRSLGSAIRRIKTGNVCPV